MRSLLFELYLILLVYQWKKKQRWDHNGTCAVKVGLNPWTRSAFGFACYTKRQDKRKTKLFWYRCEVAIMCLPTLEFLDWPISTVSFIGNPKKAALVVSPPECVLVSLWLVASWSETITTACSNSWAAVKLSVCSRGYSLISLSPSPTSLWDKTANKKKRNTTQPSKVTWNGCNYWHWEIEGGLPSMQCWRTSMSSGLHSILFQKYKYILALCYYAARGEARDCKPDSSRLMQK